MSEYETHEIRFAIPRGWRFSLGHTPHWYRRDKIPRHLRKRPFEAYVTNGEPIGTRRYVFVSADGETPMEALEAALETAVEANDAKD